MHGEGCSALLGHSESERERASRTLGVWLADAGIVFHSGRCTDWGLRQCKGVLASVGAGFTAVHHERLAQRLVHVRHWLATSYLTPALLPPTLPLRSDDRADAGRDRRHRLQNPARRAVLPPGKRGSRAHFPTILSRRLHCETRHSSSSL